MEFEQSAIIKYLRFPRTKLAEILAGLKEIYGQDSYNELDAECWLHQLKICRTNLWNEHAGGHPPIDGTDAQRLEILANRLCSSMRSITEVLGYPSSIFHVHMVSSRFNDSARNPVPKHSDWIYYQNPRTSVWFSSEDDVSDRLKVMMHSKKGCWRCFDIPLGYF
jgi:hypothetical protein